MISKNTTTKLGVLNCSLSDIPVKKETEVQKSPTVTEWDVDGRVLVNTVDPATGEPTLAQMTKVSRHTGLKMFDCTLSVSGAYSHVVTASEDHSLITLNASTLELEKTRPEDAKGAVVPRIMTSKYNDWEICAKNINARQHISSELRAWAVLRYHDRRWLDRCELYCPHCLL